MFKKIIESIWVWGPVVIVTTTIYYLSNQSTLPGLTIDYMDVVLKKMAHMTEYAILYFTWYRALTHRSYKTKNAVALSLFMIFLSALIDEIHQSFTPNRHPQFTDVGIDMVGAFMCRLKLSRFV